MHGQGIYTWPDGRKFEGNFQNDIKIGRGIMTWPNGDKLEADWIRGKEEGIGKFTNSVGVVKYG
jgi:hypothetical protein